jgi:hypothetical protein
VTALNRQRYAALLAEDVRFFSPIGAEPSVGREAGSMVLSTVLEEGALRRQGLDTRLAPYNG